MKSFRPSNTQRAPLGLRSLALFLALVCMAPTLIAADESKESRLYEDALQRFEKRDYAGAIIQLKNAIQINRRMLPVQVLLGRALLANGEAAGAEVAFDEALKLGVNPAEVVVQLAEALSLQGKPDQIMSQARFAHMGLPPDARLKLLLVKAAAASDLGTTREAIALLEEARAMDPGRAESWIAEVPIRVRAHQLKEAKAAADKAVALSPNSPEAAYQQATVAHIGGQLENAISLYSRTLQLKPGHGDSLVARGGLYLDTQRFDAATADVQAARKAAPNDPRAAYLAALLAERAGNTAEVKKSLNAITNVLDPVPMAALRYRPQALMLGGLAHFGLDQLEKAKPYLEGAQKQDPNSPVSKLLAQIYLREKNTDRAIDALTLYLRAHGNDVQATMLLASAHMAQGRHARATQLMQEALKKSDEPAVRSLLGRSLVGSGKFASGAAELEATLKRDPGQIQAGVTLAGLYLASGQTRKAVAVAEALAKRQPDNPGLLSLLGSAQAAKGDAAAARSAFEQAAKLAPTFTEVQINLARLDIDEKALVTAQTRLSAVLAKDEKNVDAAMEMARLSSARYKPDDAQNWLQRADDHSGPRLQAALQLVEFHLARHRPDLAKEALKRLQAKAPEALAVLLMQAKVQIAQADRASAKSTLTRATSLANTDAAALVQIANLQLRAGDVAGAAYALDKALGEQPEHLAARALRTDVELLQGETARAEHRARGIIASEPKLGLGHALLGDVARARGQGPAAIEAYRRAHQLDQSTQSLLRLVSALEERDRAGAIALTEQWLRTKPGDQRVWRALADAQARGGNLAAARASYESLIKLAPEDAEALNNLANILILQKDPGALALAERALALRPDQPHIIGTTGWAAFHAGQTDRALQLLRDARLRDPANADSRYFLGAALAQRGRGSEARAELEGALAGGRAFAHAKEAEALLKTLK
jgi:cellulose synthase operon protein C